MFNLLPQLEKQIIRREYRTRLAAVMLLFFFALWTAGAILLLPSYLLSRERENTAVGEYEAFSRTVAASDAKTLNAELATVRTKLRALPTGAERVHFSDMTRSLAAARSSGIAFTGLSFNEDGEKRRLALSGTAESRDDLVAFQRALETSGAFQEIDFPLSNLAKDRKVNFSAIIVNTPPAQKTP